MSPRESSPWPRSPGRDAVTPCGAGHPRPAHPPRHGRFGRRSGPGSSTAPGFRPRRGHEVRIAGEAVRARFDRDGGRDLRLRRGRRPRPVRGRRQCRPRRRRDVRRGPLALPERRPRPLGRRLGAVRPGPHRLAQGAAVADYDADGDLDLFLAQHGPDTLWQNRGDGTFRDVTAAAGLADSEWGVSAAWGDADGDGWPDLYVTNYLSVDPLHPPDPSATTGARSRSSGAPRGCRGSPTGSGETGATGPSRT